MRDYWNDPPEPREMPSCPNDKPICDGTGEYLYEGKTGHVFSCDTCGYQWVVPFPIEQEPPPNMEEPEPVKEDDQKPCPHGNDPAECDACYVASDLAYDAAKESRR